MVLAEPGIGAEAGNLSKAWRSRSSHPGADSDRVKKAGGGWCAAQWYSTVEGPGLPLRNTKKTRGREGDARWWEVEEEGRVGGQAKPGNQRVSRKEICGAWQEERGV